ncbi:hypothetical protein HUO13_24020 [Saccharopolyspora erythraea]|uniref:hypothetical protein n=1 Tax=Saccharopolyspora erythraea TaxID=1836 RepID=UPI001BABCD02|nr:hypothetical protein [Saccharopolyspora erythraea]QUH03478.1 hypothetical protein HUO13_24020 [Saccharopolyspora erythraea]
MQVDTDALRRCARAAGDLKQRLARDGATVNDPTDDAVAALKGGQFELSVALGQVRKVAASCGTFLASTSDRAHAFNRPGVVSALRYDVCCSR